VTGDGGPKTGD